MGGPKVNRSGQSRIGRAPRLNKVLGKGKRARTIKHHAKKMKNMNKKMLKYYDDVANPVRAAKEKAEAEELVKRLPGKKMRKLRKIIQRQQRDKAQMEVELVRASKKEKVVSSGSTDKPAVTDEAAAPQEDEPTSDTEEAPGDGEDWSDVEMKEEFA